MPFGRSTSRPRMRATLPGASMRYTPSIVAPAAPVARVGEIETALGIAGDIVRRIELLAVVGIGQDGHGAAALDANDAAGLRLADDDALLRIDQRPIGAGRRIVERFDLAVRVQARDFVGADE